MSNLLEKTDVSTKSKRLERNSGKLPSKLRFTSATKLSLQKNIDSNQLEKAINKLNTLYSEMISAVEIAEKTKAEEEARNKISGNAELEAKIEEDEKIFKMTNSAIVNKKIRRLSIELLKLAGRIGTYKDNYGINVKPGFAQKPPKAISVQKLYADVYKSVMSKIDLYKMAEKKGLEVSGDGEVVTKADDVPNWRKLFINVSRAPIQNVTVAMNKSKDYEEEEQEFVPTSSNKVSEEDLAYRKLLAQIGDEFELIESYEKSPNGVPLQFKDGIESRKQKLSEIFTNETGVEIKNRIISKNITNDNTDFQNLIDKVNGYNEPLSEEEHKKMEESLNEYYSSEAVSSKINELNEKDVLFTFNQHMDDVIKAETKQNDKVAVKSVEESVEETSVSKEELDRQNELNEIKRGAEEQARMLKTLYDYMDMRDKFEAEKAERERQERKALVEGAEEQARLLNAQNEHIDIINGAKEQASIIFNKQQEAISKENFDNMIKNSADIEAKNLIKKEKEYNELVNAAEEQARIINERNMIASAAEEQARMLNEQNTIIKEAEEQARMIIDSERNEEYRELKAGADAEARLIYDKNLIEDSVEEQARQLQNNNEYLDILESAEIQARILHNKDKKTRLLQDAEELAAKLKMINEEANKIDETIAGFVGQDEMDNSIQNQSEKESSTIVKMEDAYFDPEIIDSANEEARRIYDQNVMADSVEEEAKKLYEQNLIASSVEEEAKKLYEQNLIANSVEEEARRIYDQNLIADSVEEEARRIYDQNLIADSVEEEARRLYDRNIIAISAEEEAKRIYNESKAQEAAPVNPVVAPVQQAPVQTNTVVEQRVAVAPQTTTNTNSNLELIDISDRYGELTSKSNALLVKKARIDNISKRVNEKSGMINKKKEMLTSLKEELETGNYSFLKRSEEAEESYGNVKAA